MNQSGALADLIDRKRTNLLGFAIGSLSCFLFPFGAFSSKYRATAISFLSLLIGFVYLGLTGVSTFMIPTYGVKTMYSFLGVITLITVLPLAVKLVKLRAEE